MVRDRQRSGRPLRAGIGILAAGLLLFGAGCLLVPVEAHGFPTGIPVTCGGPYRLFTGDWMRSQPEGEAEFGISLRSEWERECRNQAARQAGVGIAAVVTGGFLVHWRQRHS